MRLDSEGGGNDGRPCSTELPAAPFDTARGALVVQLSRQHLEPLVTYRCSLRIGDAFGWSAWSDAAPPMRFAVKTPRPRPGRRLAARRLDAGSVGVLLEWDSFSLHGGLTEAVYHVDVAPLLAPQLADELFVRPVDGTGGCRAIVSHVLPDTEYLFVVSASYPVVSYLCEEQDGDTLSAKLWTGPSDERLLDAPLQVGVLEDGAAPGCRLRLDPRTRGGGGLPHYEVEWRTAGASWAPALCDAAGLQVEPRAGHVAACRFAGLRPGTSEAVRVELRLAVRDALARLSLAQNLWFSSVVAVYLPEPEAVSIPWTQLYMDEEGCFALAIALEVSEQDLGPAGGRRPPRGSARHEYTLCEIAVQRRSAAARRSLLAAPLAALRRGGPVVPAPPVPLLALPPPLAAKPTAGAIRGQPAVATVRLDELMPELSAPDGGLVARVGRWVPGAAPVLGPAAEGAFNTSSDDEDGTVAWSPWSRPSELQLASPPRVAVAPAAAVLAAPVLRNRKVVVELPPLSSEFGPAQTECLLELRPAASTTSAATSDAVSDCDDVAAGQLLGLGSCPRSAPGGGGGVCRLEANVLGFRPGDSYTLAVRARVAPSVLRLPSGAFVEVARSLPFRWPVSFDGAWSLAVDAALPVPAQVAIPEELEDHTTRWQGSGVLLTWPAGVTPCGSDTCPLQLQGRDEAEADPIHSFAAVQWTRVRFGNTDFVAATEVAFERGRFRWFDICRELPGPSSDLCVAWLPTSPMPAVEVFCTRRAVRVRLTVHQHQQHRPEITCYRIRHRVPAAGAVPASPWRLLRPRPLPREAVPVGALLRDVTLGEEDGLVTGEWHVFSLQLQAHQSRRAPWSPDSRAVLFDVPLGSVAAEGGALQVQALTISTVCFEWPALVPPEVFSPRRLTPGGVPRLECRVDVDGRVADGGFEHRSSALSESTGHGSVEEFVPPTEAKIFNLSPATEYRAELKVRFPDIGSRAWRSSGLSANFITPGKDQVDQRLSRPAVS